MMSIENVWCIFEFRGDNEQTLLKLTMQMVGLCMHSQHFIHLSHDNNFYVYIIYIYHALDLALVISFRKGS